MRDEPRSRRTSSAEMEEREGGARADSRCTRGSQTRGISFLLGGCEVSRVRLGPTKHSH